MFKTKYKPPTINTYTWQGVTYYRVNYWDKNGASTTDCFSQKEADDFVRWLTRGPSFA